MIGFDIDDTVFDLYPVVRTYFVSKLGYDVHPRTKHNQKVPGISEEEMVSHIGQVLNNYNEMINPCNYAIEALTKFYELTNQPIIFITSRRPFVKDATIELLNDKLSVPYNLYQTVSSKKKDLIRELDLKYFVDDRMSIVKSCRKVCKMVFLMNKLWNLNREVVLNITRVNNLIEVFDYVRKDYDS